MVLDTRCQECQGSHNNLAGARYPAMQSLRKNVEPFISRLTLLPLADWQNEAVLVIFPVDLRLGWAEDETLKLDRFPRLGSDFDFCIAVDYVLHSALVWAVVENNE